MAYPQTMTIKKKQEEFCLSEHVNIWKGKFPMPETFPVYC